MKPKNEAIPRSCALCVHASFQLTEGDAETPPLLRFLKQDGMIDEISLLCPYKKQASPAFSCRRFAFDPLKYRPKAPKALGSLDEDALLLD